MKHLLEQLLQKKDLSQKDAAALLEYFLQDDTPETFIAAALSALRAKGETSDEMLGFITTMRKHMSRVLTRGVVIDTCGTGGDGKNTFNISTTVAFVVAGAGVSVAKHGNRAASSKCGSADVLEALGVMINLSPKQAEHVLKKVGLVFLFAPLFHPAMKRVGKVRKELGVRTVFNFLGPFSNPAYVTRQIIGVPSLEIAKKLSLVACRLGYAHLIIVSSKDGLDEISPSAKTTGFEVKKNIVKKILIDPKKLGIKRATLSDIYGGTPQENAVIIKDILNGEKGARRDIVILNSAYALYVAGKTENIKEGIRFAEQSIDKGFAKKVLENLIKETQKYA